MTAYYNLNILVGSGDLTVLGVAIVTVEYVVVLTLLGLLYRRLSR